MVARQTADEIEDDAAAWILRLDREGTTPELQRALDEWLAGDPRRPGALLIAETAWRWLDIAGSAPPDTADAADPVANHEPGPDDRTNAAPWTTRRRVLAGFGAAAAACGIGYLALPRGSEHFRTARGEIRRISLADQSVATINTDSRLDIAYRSDARSISLDEGEAWFQVAHDPARPFTVSAGAVRVEAIGTAFSVRHLNGGTEVLVTEGVVRTWTIGAEDRAVRAKAGERAFVADHATIPQLSSESPGIERALAWRQGDINLGGETLAHAVAEFNRYNSVTLTVADAALARQPLYGVFRLDDPHGFARTVAAGLRVPLNRNGASSLVIGNP